MTDTLELEAIRIHRNYPKGWSPTVLVDPANVKVGDHVIAYGHGGWRLVIVTKLGPKRMRGVYTTPSAVAEARKAWERTVALNPISQAAYARSSAERNYDFTLKCSTVAGQLDKGYMRQYSNEDDATFQARIQAEADKAAARLAEMGERDAFISSEERKAHDRTVAQVERARTGGWQSFVLITNNNSTWDRVYAS